MQNLREVDMWERKFSTNNFEEANFTNFSAPIILSNLPSLAYKNLNKNSHSLTNSSHTPEHGGTFSYVQKYGRLIKAIF